VTTIAIATPLDSAALAPTLSQIWARGVRRILWRRQALTLLAGVLALCLSTACLVTCLYLPLRPWFAASLAGSAIVAFFLFLLWLYEHARAEEMIEEWVTGLPSALGCHPTASEVLSWAESLYELLAPKGLIPWKRAISQPLVIQCAERLLSYGEELASLGVMRDPLGWESHAELARILSTARALIDPEDDRAEPLKQRILDELAILQSLHPQMPEVWLCTQECAETIHEPEVELLALEKLCSILPERDPLLQYGLALFRHGFAGRAFALYRQLREEDPEVAHALLQGYQSRALRT
jgi:hypothetical protein